MFANVEVYNSASNSWRREANMPLPRHGIWASVIGNKVYIPGGGYHAGFNRDEHPDYLLFNATTRATVIWYMNNNVHTTGAYGPTLPAGWSLVAP